MLLETCTICHEHDVAVCPVCSKKQAFADPISEGTQCYGCHELKTPMYLSSPFLDPNGKFEVHCYCLDCLPPGSIQVNDY
jgi:hypothetical protein